MKKFPVGLRTIKSAAAVFLCFVVYLLRGEGIPFYSAIAAVLCMQTDVQNSVKVAFNRTVGTLIGGVFGVLVLLLERRFIPQGHPFLQYLLVSLAVIPIISLTVALGKTSASYISCVVFMSITVSHGADVSPWLFGLNRMVDTLIGIFVSLVVNSFSLPMPRDKETLFLVDLDRALPDPDGSVHPYTRFRIRRLVEEGASIAVATGSTPAHLLSVAGSMGLELPAIVLDGAALYHCRLHTYPWSCPLPGSVLPPIQEILEQEDICWGLCCLREDLLHLYFSRLDGLAALLYEKWKGLGKMTFVCGLPSAPGQTLCLLALAPKEKREKIACILARQSYGKEISFTDLDTDSALLIRSAGANREAAAEALQQMTGLPRIMVWGGTAEDIPLLQKADKAFVPSWCSQLDGEFPLLPPCPESTVRSLSHLFHRWKKEPSTKN